MRHRNAQTGLAGERSLVTRACVGHVYRHGHLWRRLMDYARVFMTRPAEPSAPAHHSSEVTAVPISHATA